MTTMLIGSVLVSTEHEGSAMRYSIFSGSAGDLPDVLFCVAMFLLKRPMLRVKVMNTDINTRSTEVTIFYE